MGGGLIQLIAYGSEDIYLTGNPQMTYFKVIYRRHTNFSIECIEQTIKGNSGFGESVSSSIARNGDLINRMYIEHSVTFTNNTGADKDIGIVDNYGHSLIKECEILIGDQLIDKHTSMWYRVWSDLTEENPNGIFGCNTFPSPDTSIFGNGTKYQLMTGNGLGLNTSNNTINYNKDLSGNNSIIINGFKYDNEASNNHYIEIPKIHLPLQFWFNKNPGLALPLIALQYQEVKIKLTFESLNNLVRIQNIATVSVFNNAIPGDSSTISTSNLSFKLFVDYIFLDNEERKRFALTSHQYLIEQLQYKEEYITESDPNINLKFNHPVKELIWCMRNETEHSNGGRNCTLTTSSGQQNASPCSLDTIKGNWYIKLNGHNRIEPRDITYFSRTKIYEHHTGYGSIPTIGLKQNNNGIINNVIDIIGLDSICVYSFALKPEEHQPSGTCNFSRIKNAELIGENIQIQNGDSKPNTFANIGETNKTDNVKIIVFAINYNILRIISGMGGLAYSN